MALKAKKRITPGRLLVLLAALLLFSCASGVFFLSNKIGREIRSSSENSLREILSIITQHTDQMFLRDEQALLRWANVFEKMDPEDISPSLQLIEKDDQIAALAFIPAGEELGITNSGESFDPAEFEFSGGRFVSQAEMSAPYMGSVGAWCYCLKTELSQEGRPLGILYGEFIYDNFRDMIPQEFYSNDGVIYMMDAESGRFVVHPNNLAGTKGGNRNLSFFLEHNEVTDAGMLEEINDGIAHGDRMMIRLTLVGRPAYMYFWPTEEGRHYLVGFVPEDSISRLSDSVTLTIVFMIALVGALLLVLAVAYVVYYRYNKRIEAERAREQERHMIEVKQALELAQSANRSKSVFLSNMSHDIRTPMNAIIGFSTLLMRDAGDPRKVREYTRKVSASSQHLLSLINDVLDMSKIESGKMVLNIGPFELFHVAAAVDTVIRPQAADKGQTLEVLVEGLGHESLLGDETRLNQILINLLSNAVKYTQEGGHIQFILRGAGHTKRSQDIEILVRDNGYGMTPEYCEHIFEAFTRAENSTTNKVQGTGLGMAITKGTVDLMGGAIQVESEYGKGSTFTVRLSLAAPEHKEPDPFWQERGFRRVLAAGGPGLCGDIRRLMGDTGVKVDTSAPRDALSIARKAREQGEGFDAFLLDWEEKESPQAAASLKKDFPQAPILALAPASWAGQTEDENISAFLQGPFFALHLKERLLDLCRDQELPEETVPDLLNGCHFLAAEDNELNAEILIELLKMQGADCHVVENGQLAVEAFEGSQPGQYDAILMDVRMPVMGGYEAARRIRALSRPDAGTIPIVAMTANAFTEDVADAMAAGMNAHVPKPVDTGLLNRTLAEITQKTPTCISEGEETP